MLTTARPCLAWREPGELNDSELADRVYRHAGCARSRLDPDEWFPLTADVSKARNQAAGAIAVCCACPVRADCLELSLRQASGIAAYGVWGGLVEEERRSLRHRWLAGASVTEFLNNRARAQTTPSLEASGGLRLRPVRARALSGQPGSRRGRGGWTARPSLRRPPRRPGRAARSGS